ncbi:MAG: 50S ribosomal protein L1 [Pleurocapsa minor GSE-CHR-MK-17-07R]|jgi:large subunit ribosomal protein L1|nr:50S ribosomal protein L1 [Pleurocapsa minor GSE-CHR-MK 17-07R]
MALHGKRYQNAAKLIDAEKSYVLADAVGLVKQISTAKFDETVELHFRLGIDPRHSDQQVRSTVLLPHGLGKSVRVLVFAEGEDARAAQAAGADLIADDELINRILKEGFLDFEAALAVPAMMPKVGRLGRILGTRGLMPNPKAGTVVQPEDIAKAVTELKAGRVEFRNDKTGNLHIPVGKASFDAEKLVDNAQAIIDAVNRQKPSAVKGIYIKKAAITTTMSPAIRLDLSAAGAAAAAAAAAAK